MEAEKTTVQVQSGVNSSNIPKNLSHFEIYLDYLQRYDILRQKWPLQRQFARDVADIWLEMSEKFNHCGGPIRDVTHWKKVFTEWKSHTRRKLKQKKNLNILEEQLATLLELNENFDLKANPLKILVFKQQQDQNNDNIKIETNNDSNNDIDRTGEINCIEQEISDNSEIRIDEEKNSEPSSSINRNLKDFASYVDEKMLGILDSNNDGINAVGAALHNLATSINRYCDIIEKRIF